MKAKASKKRCSHRYIQVHTEADRCSWVKCLHCRKTGPRKHSYMLALICFATSTINQHPRGRADEIKRR